MAYVSCDNFNNGLQYRLLYCSGMSFKNKGKTNPCLIMHNSVYKIAKGVINPLDKEHLQGYEIPSNGFYSFNDALEEYVHKVNVENGGISHEEWNGKEWEEKSEPDFIDPHQVMSKVCEHLVYEC